MMSPVSTNPAFAQPLPSPRVLLVDDDAILRSMLALLFNCSGYQVHHAANGKEALRIHHRRPADVMIVEMVLPELDGFEILRKVRAQPFMPKFIDVTGGGRFPVQDCLRAAKQLGAHHVLTKPFQPENLLATVNQLLGRPKPNPAASPGDVL
jgi:DNA-binding response OmpR family regulator